MGTTFKTFPKLLSIKKFSFLNQTKCTSSTNLLISTKTYRHEYLCFKEVAALQTLIKCQSKDYIRICSKKLKKKDQSNSILGAHIYWHSKENWKKHCILLITAAANFVNEHSSFCTRSMSNTLLNHIAKKKKEKGKETVNLLNLPNKTYGSFFNFFFFHYFQTWNNFSACYLKKLLWIPPLFQLWDNS